MDSPLRGREEEGRALSSPRGSISLQAIGEKVEAGKRITEDEALALFQSPDLIALGALADKVRRRKSGLKTYYIINHHINYSNICVATCDFCAFYRRKGQEGSWDYSLPHMERITREAAEAGASEIHMVGGLHPDYPLSYYQEILRSLKAVAPKIHLKAFTAVEIAYFAKKNRMSLQRVLEELRDAGLDTIPGGGSEIFDPQVFGRLVKGKVGFETWLEVHRTLHSMGMKSTATMLYGHIESFEHRVDHMRRLRDLQDETGGFMTFIPLAFLPANTALNELPGPSGFDDLKTVAVARIYLDNFDHIKSYWPMLGPKLSQVAMDFGADDFDGTVEQERIYHMAGSDAPQGLTQRELCTLIREGGKIPVLRDSLYNELEVMPAGVS